jgi:hypothetical protein
VLLTATIGLAAYKSTVAVTGTAGRADADGFLAAASLSRGWLRSVTEFAGPGTDAVERLDRTSTIGISVHCVPSGHIPETFVQAERSLRRSCPLLIRGFGVQVPGGAPA